jgi:uncharacterized membrane protein
MNALGNLLALSPIPEECIEGTSLCAPAISGLNTVFANVLEVALAFAGIVLFIMLLVGGFKYLTSGGDPKSVQGAKNALSWAIIGFVLVASAFLILRFIEYFTGANVTDFNVFRPS